MPKIEDEMVSSKKNIKYINEERANKVKELLLKNVAKKFTLYELACKIGCNEKTLNKSFKSVFNMTIFAWLRQQRLLKAMQLLKNNPHYLPIKQIAHVCGFKYQSDFSKAFKQYFGITPTLATQQNNYSR